MQYFKKRDKSNLISRSLNCKNACLFAHSLFLDKCFTTFLKFQSVVYFNQHFGCCAPQTLVEIFFFIVFCAEKLFLHFFSFLAQKMLKMKISTSIWGAQHPNPGQNTISEHILLKLYLF